MHIYFDSIRQVFTDPRRWKMNSKISRNSAKSAVFFIQFADFAILTDLILEYLTIMHSSIICDLINENVCVCGYLPYEQV